MNIRPTSSARFLRWSTKFSVEVEPHFRMMPRGTYTEHPEHP